MNFELGSEVRHSIFDILNLAVLIFCFLSELGKTYSRICQTSTASPSEPGDLSLGVRICRVPNAAGANARRSDAVDAVTSSRSSNTADASAAGPLRGRRSAGTLWDPGPKAQPRGGCGSIWDCAAAQLISALHVVNDGTASPLPLSLSSARKPHARDTS
jgi:hypothetical protein